jgi:3-methyladenine DNA glycosylase AlkD
LVVTKKAATKTGEPKPAARPKAAKQAAPEKPTAKVFIERLTAEASEAERVKYERYFPPAERRRGDEFIGVRMGTVFELAKAFALMPPQEIEKLLESEVHEVRAGAVSIMAKQAQLKTVTDARRQALYDLYLRRHDRINDWDLVDLGAWYVVGRWLVGRPHDVLYRLAKSKDPWERRTAILATFSFMRQGDYDDTFALAELMLKDPHPLTQKAVGWALRVAGEVPVRLHAFLDKHAATMPRAMLRNAIEKFSPEERAGYLKL